MSINYFQDTTYHAEIVLKNTRNNSEAFGDFLILKIVSKNVESAEMNAIFETIVKDAEDGTKFKNLTDVADEMTEMSELTKIVTEK